MAINNLGTSLSIEKVLPLFFDVKKGIGVTDAELLKNLTRWHEFAPKSINKENIKTIIPSAIFFEHSVATKTELTDYLNRTIIEALTEVDTNTLYRSKANTNNDYWWVAMKFLISSDFMKPLPNNVNELGKLILRDIATGTQTSPIHEPLKSIVDKLDKRTTQVTIKDIKNDFCNGITHISAAKFIFFADWFEKQGDLTIERAGGVCSKILKPVISDNNCLGIILNKTDFYSEIINIGGDEAYELKTAIKNIIKTNTDPKLISFAEKIGIEPKDSTVV